MKKKLPQKLVFFILVLLLALLTIIANLYMDKFFDGATYAQEWFSATANYIMVPILALIITKVSYSHIDQVVRLIMIVLTSGIAIVMLVGLMLMKNYGTFDRSPNCPPQFEEVCNGFF